MSIGPIQIVPVVAEGSTARETAQPARTAPSSGGGSTVESSGTQSQVSLASVAEEEVVEVHSDTSMGLPLPVYQFVDSRSGSVVLQIPSEQMLKLVQDIRQRLQQMEAKQPGEAK